MATNDRLLLEILNWQVRIIERLKKRKISVLCLMVPAIYNADHKVIYPRTEEDEDTHLCSFLWWNERIMKQGK